MSQKLMRRVQGGENSYGTWKIRNFLLAGCVLVCGFVKPVYAFDGRRGISPKSISIEYLKPLEDDRNIKTINLDYNVDISTADMIDLKVYADFMATYATGDITQLEGEINKGTLREINYKNRAFGAGSGILLSFRLMHGSGLSINLNGSGQLVLYSDRFPAGGDYYNFMWRVGPMMVFGFGKRGSIGVSYQVSHVSNGQGVSQKNPSYDAVGFALRYTGLF